MNIKLKVITAIVLTMYLMILGISNDQTNLNRSNSEEKNITQSKLS